MKPKIIHLIKVVDIKFNSLLKNDINVNMSGSQIRILHYLSSNIDKEVHSTDLEKELEVSKATISGILSRMQDNNLISIESSRVNKRYKKVVITREGLKLNKYLIDNFDRKEKLLYKDISKKDIEVTRKVLEKMLENMKEEIRND
ncbi:MAG: MarR family transcriptional regulator [Thomasclavelia sp.]|nr:MarR family transcriptional regulator [Thomasclavelia sp.]